MRQTILISIINIVLFLAAMLFIGVLRQNGEPNVQAHIITPQIESESPLAQAYRLAAQSNSVLDNSYQGLVHSVLLATESLSQTYTLEGEIALRRGLSLLPRPSNPTQHDFALEVLTTTNTITQAVSPDGQWIATNDDNGTVQVLAVISNTEMARIPYATKVNGMVFSLNGERFAIADGNMVYFWDIESGRKLGQIVYDGTINQIAISPDGQRLAIAGWPIAVQVWETIDEGFSWREVARMGYESKYPEEMNVVAFSSDGQRLFTKSKAGVIQVWEVDTILQAGTMTHLNPVCRVLFSEDGQWLVAKSENYTVTRILNTTTFQEITSSENDTVVYNQKQPLCDRWPVIVGLDVAFSSDSRWLAASAGNHTIRLWDLSLEREVAVWQHDDRINQITFSKDNQWVATASDDGTARIWDVFTGRELKRLEHGTFTNGSDVIQTQPVNTVAISPDKQLIATGSRESARLWDSNTGREIFRFENEPLVSPSMTFNWHVNKVFFSENGQWLIGQSTASLVTERGYQARIWDVATGKEIIKAKDLAGPKSIVFNDDGQKLAIGYHDEISNDWRVEVRTNQEVALMDPNPVTEILTFSPDSRWLAAGGGSRRHQSGMAIVWDAQTAQELSRIPNDLHNGPVRDVIFTPDQISLITLTSWSQSYEDGWSVRIWDIATGRKVMHLSYDQVESMALSPNGRWLATASRNGTVRLLLLKPEDLVIEACARLTRNLTELEWRQAFGNTPYQATCPNLAAMEEE